MSRAELVRELKLLLSTSGAGQAGEEGRARQPGPEGSGPHREVDGDQMRQVIHELHVHQVELEMQNRELRESRELLEQSRSRFSDLYDFAPVSYLTLDENARVLEINLTGAALFGMPREAIVGLPFVGLTRMEDPSAFHEHLRACAGGLSRVVTELTISVRGRGLVTVQMVSALHRPAGGARPLLRTALIDLSARKELEDRLRLLAVAGEALGSSLDTSTTLASVVRLAVPLLGDLCFVDLIDEDGQIQRVHTELANPSREEQIRARSAVLAGNGAGSTAQNQVIASGVPVLYEDIPEPDGHEDAASESSAQLMTAVGTRSMMIVPLTARGRTFGALTLVSTGGQRRYTTEDLAFAGEIARRGAMAVDNAHLHALANRAVRAREDVLAMVSHDLRNPLSVIMARASQLLEHGISPGEPERTRAAMESILRSTERMNRLISDMLDAATLELGQFQIQQALQSMHEIVADVLEAHAPQAAARGILIAAELDQGALDASCDRERIIQVLSNLLGNAIKYSPPGSPISLQARRGAAGDLWVAVDDCGPGIAPADLPHIFDRYWHGRRAGRGSVGLGLSIARGIVEAHGGRIWVEARPGGGSSFRFTLPRGQDATCDRGTILVVDDDPEVRLVLGEILDERGFAVAEAANGQEALAYLEKSAPPTAILLDLMMPVMDGEEVLDALMGDPRLRAIPVIVISAQPRDGRSDLAQHALYLRKPIEAEPLRAALDRLSG